jgi:hypothetical protein
VLPTWIFLVCLAAAFWGRHEARMVTVFLASCVCGASAALTVVLMGGAPVTPALFFVPLLVMVAWRMAGWRRLMGGFSLREPGGWLALFVGWALFTAVFMPRIFKGQVLVYTTSRDDAEALGVTLTLLAPNSTNITQAIYLLVGLATFMALRAILRDPSHHRWLKAGFLAAAALNLLFALWDALGAFAGMEVGMGFVRNANYAIVSQRLGGLPRLQAAFSEPSALAGYSTGLFAVLLMMWLKELDGRRSGAMAIATGAVLLLTLSSTAFVSFALVLTAAALLHAWRRLIDPRRSRLGWQAALLAGLTGLACVLLLWNPPWLTKFGSIVWTMVVEKSESESAIERLAWATATWQNFVDTYGLGTGAGSARGSSWPLVVLGNTGWPGAALLLVFLGMCLFQSGKSMTGESSALLAACRLGLFALLMAISLSGTMIDPGLFFFGLAGSVAGLLACASEQSRREQQALPEDMDEGLAWPVTVMQPRTGA